MRAGRGHILLTAAVAALCIAGCARSGRVIPKKDMIALYTDMFIADQWLRDNSSARAAADTTLFFDPIFRRHGYSFADYEKSIEYYSGRTEDLREVMDSVSKRLKNRAEHYRKLSERIREAREENERLRVDYTAVDFSDDSLVWALDGILWPLRDSLAVSDSLAAADSIAVSADSLARAKGLREMPDSVGPHRFLRHEPDLRPERRSGREGFEERELKKEL